MSREESPFSYSKVAESLDRFREVAETGWAALPFFREGAADAVAADVDARAAARVVLPPAADVFRALLLTPPDRVKAVVLGQDPYPRPGDAHGLAFSYAGAGRIPASLRVILTELEADLGIPRRPGGGNLTRWAEQGVLLLNTALTTEAGMAGAHLKLGWSQLVDEILAFVSASRPAVAFLLWGLPARRRAVLIDPEKHLVLESGHPSPLNRARDFVGSRPFSRTNAWLISRGVEPIDWRLE